MDSVLIISSFLAGLLSGVLIVRYGIGLGTKLVYKIQNNVPLDETESPTEQDVTGD